MDSKRAEAQGTVHLDTVRALHQTVVSLRTALEVSKNELKELKDKYEKHSKCEFTDVIEKLTIENHVLRRKIIDAGYTYDGEHLEAPYSGGVVIESAISDNETLEGSNRILEEPELLVTTEEESESGAIIDVEVSEDTPSIASKEGEISETYREESKTSHHPTFKTKLELLSKFDVKIKVCTIKDGVVTSSTTSDTESTFDSTNQEKRSTESQQSYQFEEHREHFDNKDIDGLKLKTRSVEDIKMAVPTEIDAKGKNDNFNIQVRITSEENIVMKETDERKRKKETMTLDVDDLSIRSLSEGDNSVFSEYPGTPVDQEGLESTTDKKFDQDIGSGNDSEEVDDIELIFTTDESKDMSNLQEDLVSIKESDWGPSPTSTTHSTPVLIKFHTLDPDYQLQELRDNKQNDKNPQIPEESILKSKRVSLPDEKEIKHVAFIAKTSDLTGRPGILKSFENKVPSKESLAYKRSTSVSSRLLNSTDSLSCDYTRGLSVDASKSSSFELGSSMDILNRDESFDNFHKNAHLGHRFSIYAENDMSKCGISEDDLASMNLNLRRNTCPNALQYRPPPYRGFSRPTGGPFKATVTSAVGRTRPILRGENYSARKENGAQTEVSALPNRWSSDGYLAHKVGISRVLPTLPSRTSSPARRPTMNDNRTSLSIPKTDSRRILLSDLGFTSMVPELSRSADPLWRAPCACPCPYDNTSKFLSRGSSFRSPCLSVDRSNDWVPSFKEHRAWRTSLPDVRRDDTDDLLDEAEVYLRRSIDNLRSSSVEVESESSTLSRPYLPAEPRHLRLGHAVKVITPQGRIAVGKVRYVGLAGTNASDSCIMVGAIFPLNAYPWLPLNDGTHRSRRYFHAPPHHTALFVPFAKVVMAWANS